MKLPPEFYTMFARAFFSQLMKRYGGVIFRRLFVSIPVAAAQPHSTLNTKKKFDPMPGASPIG